MKNIDLLLVDVPAEIQLPDALTPSLGLMYIASYLLNKGYRVGYLDGYIKYVPIDIIKLFNKEHSEIIRYNFPIRDFIEEIVRFKAPIIGLSCSFTSSIYNIQKIVKKIKKHSPDSLIILGGYHASSLPKKTLDLINGCDIVVIREGELTMEEILMYNKGNYELSNIKGIAYRNNDKTIVTPSRPLISDLDLLPYPERSLAPIKHYNRFLHSIGSHECSEGSLISSRGCPYNCIYCCVSSVHGRSFRERSASNVIDEIISVKDEYNTSYFKFQDDIFTLNKKRVIELCKKIIKNRLDIIWGCQTRVDCVDKELLILMKKAGCKYMSFGVESGDPQILKNLKKNITIEQIKTATKLAKSIDIYVNYSLIVGNPGENRITLQNTINLVKKLKPNSAGVAIMIPYPGSEIYNSNVEKISKNWQLYRQSGVKKPPFIPKGLNLKQLFFLWQNSKEAIYKILGQDNRISIIYPHIITSDKYLV